MELLKQIEKTLNDLNNKYEKEKEEVTNNPDSKYYEVQYAIGKWVGTRDALFSFYKLMNELEIEEKEFLDFKGNKNEKQ